MDSYLIDKLLMGIALVVPILLIAKWRFRGAIAGSIFVWGTLFLAGIVLSKIDPSRNSVLDAIWMLLGFIGGAFYCVPVWGILELVRKIINRKESIAS